MKKGLFVLSLCAVLASCAHKAPVADYRVVPLPQEISLMDDEAFVLTACQRRGRFPFQKV